MAKWMTKVEPEASFVAQTTANAFQVNAVAFASPSTYPLVLVAFKQILA
jgi:hypothetical protein